MAGATARLLIDIASDTDTAVKGLDDTARAADKASGKIGHLDDSFAGLDGSRSKVDKLNNSLEATGDHSGTASSGLGALAGALGALPLGAVGAQLQTSADLLGGLEGVTQLWTLATTLASGAQERLAASTALQTVKTIASTIAQKAVQAATIAWTAAQWLLNAALNANPIGLIIIGVLALVAAIVLLWKKSAAFRNVVIAVWNAILVAVRAVVGAILTAWNFLYASLSTGVKFFVAVVRAEFAIIRAIALAVFGAAKVVILGAIQAGIAIFNALKSTVSTVFSGIRGTISSAIGTIKGLFAGLRSFVTGVFNTMMIPVNMFITGLTRTADGIKKVIDWISRIHFPSPPAWLSSIVPFSVAPAPGPAPVSLAALQATRTAAGVLSSPTSGLLGNTAASRSPILVANVDVTLDGAKVGSFVDRIVMTRMADDGARLAAGAWGW